jgi:hypothetical protein
MPGDIRRRGVRRGRWACAGCRGGQHAVYQEVRRDRAGIPRRDTIDTDQQADGALHRLVKLQFILIQPYGSRQFALEPLGCPRVQGV